MKINRSIAAALLLACASRAFSAVGADPNDKLDKLFVGRYGEIVSFDKGMSVLARNRGDMEVVDFYAPERYVNGHFIRFDPEKVKLTPNVFVQEDLIELIAAPAAASRYPHLTDQRKAYWGLPTHDRFNYYERMLSDECTFSAISGIFLA